MGFQAILGEFLYPGTSFSISCGYPSAESWENWAVPADRDLPKNAKKVRLEERAHLCHSIFPGKPGGTTVGTARSNYSSAFLASDALRHRFKPPTRTTIPAAIQLREA